MAINPQVVRKLMREISDLKKSSPDDIRICVQEDDAFSNLTAIIRGPEGTPFANGYFRVKFKFTSEFPQKPPSVFFTTKIFHPNVSPTNGSICVSTLSKDWSPNHTLTHVLMTIRCLLVAPNPDSALDEEAGRLIQEDYNSYVRRARIITSVHATPKTPPKEFEESTPSSTSHPTEPSPHVPSAPLSSSSSSNRPEDENVYTAPPPSSRKPLSTTSSTSPPTSSKVTETTNNATPLGTNDANVVQPVKTKRSAAATGLVGGEKRKKALKRL